MVDLFTSKIILFDNDIFLKQKYGGIRTYFTNLILNINKLKNNIKVHSSSLNCVDFCPRSFLGKNYFKTENIYLAGSFLRPIYEQYFCNKKLIYHPTYYRNILLRIIKIPKVITVHDMVHEIHPEYFAKEYRKKIRFYVGMKKNAIFNADHIICPSYSTKNDLLNVYRRLENKRISVVHHGINDPWDFKDEENGIKSSVKGNYILFVGSRNHYKGFENVFKAFLKLRKKIKDLKLICVGSKPSKKEKEEYRYSDLKNIIIYKQVNNFELQYLYKNALAFIYPSFYEGFGFPILEAMANNCPVISTSISSSKEVGGEIPFFVDKFSVDQIIDRVLQIFYKEYDSSILKKGNLHAKKFTWKKCALKTSKIYQNL